MNTDTKLKDGGPAFPVPEALNGIAPGFGGMSLRDWFATHASEEDIKSVRRKTSDHYGYERFTDSRERAKYRYADAMLSAREQKDAT